MLENAATTLNERYLAVVESDARVRADLTRLQVRRGPSVSSQEIRETLERFARSLRVELAALAFLEALHRLGVRTLEDVKASAATILAKADRIAGFEVIPVLRTVTSAASSESSAELEVDHIRRLTARHVLSRLEGFPGSEVALLTKLLDDAALSHVIRQDAERLEALARRADDVWIERLRDAGEMYVEGRVELADVARLLGLAPAELAAEFERLGFIRALETLSLSADERVRRLELILTRRHQTDRTLVARDVVASQRIEGIDARRHPAVTELSLPDER